MPNQGNVSATSKQVSGKGKKGFPLKAPPDHYQKWYDDDDEDDRVVPPHDPADEQLDNVPGYLNNEECAHDEDLPGPVDSWEIRSNVLVRHYRVPRLHMFYPVEYSADVPTHISNVDVLRTATTDLTIPDAIKPNIAGAALHLTTNPYLHPGQVKPYSSH